MFSTDEDEGFIENLYPNKGRMEDGNLWEFSMLQTPNIQDVTEPPKKKNYVKSPSSPS